MKRKLVVLSADGDNFNQSQKTQLWNVITSTHLDVSEIKINITDGYCDIRSHALASMKDQSCLCKIVIDGDYVFCVEW